MSPKKRFPSATQTRDRLERVFRAEGWLAVERASEYTHLKTWMRPRGRAYGPAQFANFRKLIIPILVAKNFKVNEEEYAYGPWISGDEWEIDRDGHTICISCRRTIFQRPG